MNAPRRLNAHVACHQLDLFEGTEPPVDGLTWNEARATLPPGWWSTLHILWQERVGVVRCEEVNGRLALVLHSLAEEDLDAIAAQVKEAVLRRCAACGAAASLRGNVGTSPRVLCATCAKRIREGEDFINVADDHFLWNGERRSTPTRVVTVTKTKIVKPRYDVESDELRELYTRVLNHMLATVIGQDEAVAAVALAGTLHAATNTARGSALVLSGPTGCGKTTIALALRRALRDAGYDLPFFLTTMTDLTTNAWSGAPSINRLIESAIQGLSPDGERARRLYCVIDECEKLRKDLSEMHGNMLARAEEQHAALMPLIGGGIIPLGDEGRQYDASRVLVIGAGTFTAFPRGQRLTTADLTRYFPLELASRFEQIVHVKPLEEQALIALMQRWPQLADTIDVAKKFGIEVRIDAAVFRRAARLVLKDSNTTPRTAASYIVSALRAGVVQSLAGGFKDICITPDSLDVPLVRPPSSNGPEDDHLDVGTF